MDIESIKYIFQAYQREPEAMIVASLLLLVFGFVVGAFLSKKIIEGKNATIESKDASIDFLERKLKSLSAEESKELFDRFNEDELREHFDRYLDERTSTMDFAALITN